MYKTFAFFLMLTACTACNHTINATELLSATNSTTVTPIIGYVYNAYINCYNFTCNVSEAFVPVFD